MRLYSALAILVLVFSVSCKAPRTAPDETPYVDESDRGTGPSGSGSGRRGVHTPDSWNASYPAFGRMIEGQVDSSGMADIESSNWMLFFVSDKDTEGTTNVYAKSPSSGDRGSVTQITFDPMHSERDPAVSPDGKYIAYASDMRGKWEIFVAPMHDTRQFLCVSDGFPGEDNRHPSWSPLYDDGYQLVYHTYNATQGLYLLVLVDLSIEYKYTAPEEPREMDAFAPIGNPLVALAMFPGPEATENETPFSVSAGPYTDIGSGMHPSWRPKSRHSRRYEPLIIFENVRRHSMENKVTRSVTYVKPDGLGRTEIYDGGTLYSAITPSWSPDGDYVVFATAGKYAEPGEMDIMAEDICRIPLGGGQHVILTSGENPRNWNPVWHVDGRVYYQSLDENDAGEMRTTIYSVDAG
ncbi:MAG: hypothetical protein NUW37_03530 [Planctomycetes bacterium]|nr:hypothetical protein [Planctomycetota bacterium]